MTLPLTLIGGYLGAGKTTLVNHLIRHADGLKLAILVNEFGALPIDQDLIEARDDNIISIAGGCVCCSYGNDLILALMELTELNPAPEHVLLEASGVALPGAIAASVSLLNGYSTDGIVILANAETIRDQASDTYIGDTIRRQLGHADLLVLNKTDLVTDTEQASTVAWLEDQGAGAQVITTSHGALPPAAVLQSFVGREYSGLQPVHEPDLFTTISLALDTVTDPAALAEKLAESTLGLVRAKGFVQTPASLLMTIQVVGRRWSVTQAPANARPGLVVIGQTASIDVQAVQDLVARVTNIKPDRPR